MSVSLTAHYCALLFVIYRCFWYICFECTDLRKIFECLVKQNLRLLFEWVTKCKNTKHGKRFVRLGVLFYSCCLWVRQALKTYKCDSGAKKWHPWRSLMWTRITCMVGQCHNPYHISGCLLQTYTILIFIIFHLITNTVIFWKWA